MKNHFNAFTQHRQTVSMKLFFILLQRSLARLGCLHRLVLPLFLLGTLACNADDRDEKIRALEKRLESYDEKIRQLEERLAAQETKDTAPSKTTPLVSMGQNGFIMQSADTNFVLQFKGLLQVDSRSFFDDGGIKSHDTFLVRRARPIIEGTIFRDFDFRLQTEFGGSGTPTLRDAFLNYRYSDEFQLKIGKFKVPVGLERLASISGTLFIERSLVSDITPSRDIGVEFHGKALDGLLNYAAGVFNGVGDGRMSSGVDLDGEKSFAARLFVYPWRRIEVKALQQVGVGVGSSYGRSEGAAALPSRNGFDTEGQQQFFNYRIGTGGNPNVVADGNHWRVSPQASWYWGPWSALAEYVISSQELRRSDTGLLRTLRNTAWQIAAGYVLTGEEASDHGVNPRHPFNPHENHWGALEMVARVSSLEVDDAAFPVFADPAKSAAEAMAWAIGFNWYLNRNIRASANYMHTDFRGGRASAVTAQDENAFFTRVQLSF